MKIHTHPSISVNLENVPSRSVVFDNCKVR